MHHWFDGSTKFTTTTRRPRGIKVECLFAPTKPPTANLRLPSNTHAIFSTPSTFDLSSLELSIFTGNLMVEDDSSSLTSIADCRYSDMHHSTAVLPASRTFCRFPRAPEYRTPQQATSSHQESSVMTSNSFWIIRQTHYPLPILNAVPNGRPQRLPPVQQVFSPESVQETDLCEQVKEVFSRYWTSYRGRAWMHESYDPVTPRLVRKSLVVNTIETRARSVTESSHPTVPIPAVPDLQTEARVSLDLAYCTVPCVHVQRIVTLDSSFHRVQTSRVTASFISSFCLELIP